MMWLLSQLWWAMLLSAVLGFGITWWRMVVPVKGYKARTVKTADQKVDLTGTRSIDLRDKVEEVPETKKAPVAAAVGAGAAAVGAASAGVAATASKVTEPTAKVSAAEADTAETPVVAPSTAKTSAVPSVKSALTAEKRFGEGAAFPPLDGTAPDGYDVKADIDSMVYYTPESLEYDRLIASVWFKSASHARKAGFLPDTEA